MDKHPNKKLKRDRFTLLDGIWDACIIKAPYVDTSFNKRDERTIRYNEAKRYDKKILVPYSPETKKSGVDHILLPDEELWYKRAFTYKRGDNHLFLCFIAVDWRAVIYINGKFVMIHEGGYTPFECDITNYLIDGENIIEVKVHDFSDSQPYSRGKQSLNPHGMWYRCQSGIYQDVYLEERPIEYIESIYVETIDNNFATIFVKTNSDKIERCTLNINNEVIKIKTNVENKLDISSYELWSFDNPKLYEFTVEYKNDLVSSYATFRYLSYIDNRFAINNRVFFSNGVLDQGYSPNGFLTLSDDEMLKDLRLIKDLGFNSIRKHIKVEAPTYYYLCDKLGLYVWQDFVSGGSPSFLTANIPAIIHSFKLNDNKHERLFGRSESKGREEFLYQAREIVNHLKHYNCIILWTIFNEGWGQFNSRELYKEFKEIDKTRFFDSTSGWHDQGCGEIVSHHYYFSEYKYKKDRYSRSSVLSEFGGNIFRIKDHVYNDKDFIYKKITSKDAFLKRLRDQFENVKRQKEAGLTGSIYTQTTDIEEESNGFITFDREVIKADVDALREIITILND